MLLFKKQKGDLTKFNKRKETETQLQSEKQNKKRNGESWKNKTVLGVRNPWVALIVIAQFVSGPHQSNQWAQASELISQTLCAVDTSHHPFQLPPRHQPISLSCPCLGRKRGTQLPHSVKLRCCYICMKTNYFLSKSNERVGRSCTTLLWEKEWVIFLWSLISYRAENRAGDCLSQERWSSEWKALCFSLAR